MNTKTLKVINRLGVSEDGYKQLLDNYSKERQRETLYHVGVELDEEFYLSQDFGEDDRDYETDYETCWDEDEQF